MLANMSRGMWLSALLVVTACGSDIDDRPVSFSYIHAAIIVPNCATSQCHSTLSRAGTNRIDLQKRETAYDVFFDVDAHEDIVALMEGRVPNFTRMPPDQPLPAADIDLVRQWYVEGKLDN